MKKIVAWITVFVFCFLSVGAYDAQTQGTRQTPNTKDRADKFYEDFPTFFKLNNESAEFKALAYLLYLGVGQCDNAVYWRDELIQLSSDYGSLINGIAFANGDCVERNFLMAEYELRQCMKRDSSCELELLHLHISYNKINSEIINLADNKAKDGNPLAMALLVDCYYRGIGIIKNEEKALYWAYLLHASPASEGYIREMTSEVIEKIERILTYDKQKEIRNASEVLYKKLTTKTNKNKMEQSNPLDYWYSITPDKKPFWAERTQYIENKHTPIAAVALYKILFMAQGNVLAHEK